MKTRDEIKKATAYKNPSYDKSLSIRERLLDFLGKYHIILNGVVPHEPFDLKHEGHPEKMCDTEDKENIIEFVELLLKQHDEEVITAIKKALPTHKGKMLLRTEVKKVLDTLKGE